MPIAVILDMDGLMLDTEPIAWRAFEHASHTLPCDFGDELFHRLLGLNQKSARELLRGHYGEGFELDRFLELVRDHYEAALRTDGVPHKAGLLELLDFLDARGIPKAVATSTATETARDCLRRANVLSRFTVVVGGDQIKHGKPAPDIFLAAATQLGADPEECVVLEDSGPGVRAAAAAGMRSILVPDMHGPSSEIRELVYAVVPSLVQAIRILESLVSGLGGVSESS